ncbi:response regulator transcription factor [Ramlibacter solisilvae]|uniref:LuxR family transcriptional regulator n=1 Tax=Ramlibacter tataouinensis TaxID=94132 RepID=A0A127JYS3_9BURK|nr:response regulator transcription factor [Ramlibacter tataouinensis]AMO25120.1 LuxR family transcriptional regulator [Ramlibacter tataouinensis]
MIRVLVVDDHRIFRAGIARLMSDEPDMRVTGEAADGASALALLRGHDYDVVLLDINMGTRNGFETLGSIRAEHARLPVIMLSMYAESHYARLAIKSRANAYLSKDVGTDELLRAVRQVAGGGVYVPLGIGFNAPAPGPVSTGAPPHESLSPREMQVMLKIAQGISLTDIGTQLCLSVKTIGSHRTRILEKLAISSNAELVQYAMRHGLVD